MLKYVFCALLIANGVLFAWHQGYLDGVAPSGREPGRLRAQFNADKIRLMPLPPGSTGPAGALTNGTPTSGTPTSGTPTSGTPTGGASASGPATTGTTTGGASSGTSTSATLVPAVAAAGAVKQASITAAVVPPVGAAGACVDVGGFNIAEAKRFETQVASIAPGMRLVRHEVPEISSHMVFIPPQAGKEGADKKMSELRRLGLTDLYVIQDNSALRWGISLGIFKSEEVARAHLAALGQRGVRSARLIEHRVELFKVNYQLRGLDAAAQARIDRIKAGYPRQEWRDCQ